MVNGTKWISLCWDTIRATRGKAGNCGGLSAAMLAVMSIRTIRVRKVEAKAGVIERGIEAV